MYGNYFQASILILPMVSCFPFMFKCLRGSCWAGGGWGGGGGGYICSKEKKRKVEFHCCFIFCKWIWRLGCIQQTAQWWFKFLWPYWLAYLFLFWVSSCSFDYLFAWCADDCCHAVKDRLESPTKSCSLCLDPGLNIFVRFLWYDLKGSPVLKLLI